MADELRPIQEAPCDESIILNRNHEVGSYSFSIERWVKGKGWIEFPEAKHIEPTHWAPLPKPLIASKTNSPLKTQAL